MEIGKIGMPDYSRPAGKAGAAKSDAAAAPSDQFTRGDKPDLSLRRAVRALVDGESKPIAGVATRQFADCAGRVKHLALMLSSYASGSARTQILDAYKTMFATMEPDTKFTIVVDTPKDRADVEKVIAGSGAPNPERFVFIDPKQDGLTVWARDMMVPLYIPGDSQHTALLEQSMLHNWHGSDTQVPEYITKQHPSIILDKNPRLVTDGGDVMANTKESFVGYYSIAATTERLAVLARSDASLREDIIDYYQKETGKEVVKEPGKLEFPFKFVPVENPGRTHRFPDRLVANPDFQEIDFKGNQVSEVQMYSDIAVKLFEQTLGKPVTPMGADDPKTPEKEEPATDHLDMGLTPIDDRTFLLGDPALARDIFAAMTPAERRDAEKKLSAMAGRPIKLDDVVEQGRNGDNPRDFDNYENILKDKGYNVVRLPHSEPNGWGPYLSYNNCLVENFQKDGKGIKRVFLPTYGIAKLDGYATQAYQKLGFQVIPMPLDGIATRWGALRCITNWLERTPHE